MAIRYKALTELYQEAQRSVTAPGAWQRFLVSACRNYRLPFDEQFLVHAQRRTPPPSWRSSDGINGLGAG